MRLTDESIDKLGVFICSDCKTNPEIYEMTINDIVKEFQVSATTAAVILFTAQSWYETTDESLKDFLKHWLEDYMNVNRPNK